MARSPDTSGREVIGILGQVLRAVLGDEDEILQTHAAEALPVETGLERDDVTGDEVARSAAEPGRLVHLEADAVAEPVEEAVVEHLARGLRELRRVARVLEHLADESEDVHPRDAGPGRLERAVERLLNEPVVLDDLVRRLADDVGTS